MKLNKKGITSVELLICFIIISAIVVSMYNLILNYKNKAQIEAINNEVIAFSNNLQKVIQNDLIMGHLVDITSISEDGHSASFSFDNPNQYSTTISIKPDEGIISYGKVDDVIDYKIPAIPDLVLSSDCRIEYVSASNGYLKMTIILNHPNFPNETYSFMINCPITIDNTIPIDEIIENIGEKCEIVDDGENTFITNCPDPDNYIWYSGKLWRIVSIDSNTKAIKVITNETISAMGTWGKNSNFSGSYMQSWLNNTNKDGFLGSLRNPDNFINMNSSWNATMMTNATSKPPKTTMVTNAVGLLNSYEYSKDISWLLTNEYYYLLNPSSTSNVWKNGDEGSDGIGVFKRIGVLYYKNGCMIRPVVNFLPTVKIIAGNGTKENPYRIEGDNDEIVMDDLNTRFSGEWVNFNGGKWRIVSAETGGMTKIVATFSIKDSAFSTNNNSKFSITDTSNIGYYLNNDYYNSIESNSKEMLTDGPWYIGTFDYGKSWKLEKCSTEECSSSAPSITAKIGMLRHTELMAGHTGDNLESYWSITPGTTPANSVKVNGIYGSDWEEVANRTTGIYDGSILKVRPAVYLKSTVKITGGNGTKENPFTIELQ